MLLESVQYHVTDRTTYTVASEHFAGLVSSPVRGSPFPSSTPLLVPRTTYSSSAEMHQPPGAGYHVVLPTSWGFSGPKPSCMKIANSNVYLSNYTETGRGVQ